MDYSFFLILMVVLSFIIFIPVYLVIRNVSLVKLGFVAIEVTLLGGILLLYKSMDSLFFMVTSHLLLYTGILLTIYLTIKKEK